MLLEGTKIWLPSSVIVQQGDDVELTLINKLDEPHGFKIEAFGIEELVQPKAQMTVKFTASKGRGTELHLPHTSAARRWASVGLKQVERTMLQQYLDVAIAAAKAAGEVILPYFRTALQIETKADQSPVTAADRAGEQVIVETLRRHFPDHGMLGEEFGAQPGRGDARWIIDPIDGTQNFIRGIPFFGTLIALEQAGEIHRWGGACASPGRPPLRCQGSRRLCERRASGRVNDDRSGPGDAAARQSRSDVA